MRASLTRDGAWIRRCHRSARSGTDIALHQSIRATQRSRRCLSALGIQPAQKLWRFRLRVVTVESVAGIENFLRGQEGKTIEVYSNEVNAPAETSQRVTVRLRTTGDERATRSWIVGTIVAN